MDVNGQLKKISMMSPSKEREILISKISTFCSFLKDSSFITEEEYDTIYNHLTFDYKISNGYFKRERNDFLNSYLKLISMYKDILTHSSTYPLIYEDDPYVNFRKMLLCIRDFFEYLGGDILNLFIQMYDDGHININNSLKDAYGKTYKIGNDKSFISFKHYDNSFYSVLTLVHEMGHAYHYYLSKNCTTLGLNSKLGIECMSILFQELFFNYLREQHILSIEEINTIERNDLVRYLSYMNSSYIFNNITLNNIELFDDPQIFNYLNGDISYEDYLNHSLIIFPKILSLKGNYKAGLNDYNNNYSYGYLYAMVMRERFKKDPEEVKKQLKLFPYYFNTLPICDLIDIFDKTEYLNATKRNISRILTKNKR